MFVRLATAEYAPMDGRESWSSGYGRRLMFKRLWVRIPAPYARYGHFSHSFIVKYSLIKETENKAVNTRHIDGSITV